MKIAPKAEAPQVNRGIPIEPDWDTIYADVLDQMAAQDAWSAAVREMLLVGTLSMANGPALRRLVDFTVVYARAARHVAEAGPVLRSKRAKVGQWNPYFSVMNKASAELRALEAELGLTPTTRRKAEKAQPTKPRPWIPADEFLAPRR